MAEKWRATSSGNNQVFLPNLSNQRMPGNKEATGRRRRKLAWKRTVEEMYDRFDLVLSPLAGLFTLIPRVNPWTKRKKKRN